jgi:hypothetical protein
MVDPDDVRRVLGRMRLREVPVRGLELVAPPVGTEGPDRLQAGGVERDEGPSWLMAAFCSTDRAPLRLPVRALYCSSSAAFAAIFDVYSAVFVADE